MLRQLLFAVVAAFLTVAVAAGPTSNPDQSGVYAMKKGQKVSTISVTWNQDYSKIDTFQKFSQRWRYLCETVVAPSTHPY